VPSAPGQKSPAVLGQLAPIRKEFLMRTRLSPRIAAAVHSLALRQGRSDQEACDHVISLGLRSLGSPLPPVSIADDGAAERDEIEIKVRLPVPRHRAIRMLANQQNRSGRAMTRLVIDAGLKALGVDLAPPAPANTEAAA
jgi:hypothetical protein